MIITLQAPLRVPVSKNKDFILNMNNYRNTHYMLLNKAKVTYKEAMEFYIGFLPKCEKLVRVIYKVFPASHRRGDSMNVASIHSKFFLDALVECGVIPDDTWHHVPEEVVQFGEVSKNNPRVEITIEAKPMLKIEKAVKISVTQQDLEDLVRAEIARQDPTIVVDEINFKATRNPAGVEVTVTGHAGSPAELTNTRSVKTTEKDSAQKKEESQPSEEEISSSAVNVTEEESGANATESDEDTRTSTEENSSEAQEEEPTFEDEEMSHIDAALAEDEDDAPFNEEEGSDPKLSEPVEDDAEAAPEKPAPRKSLFAKK